MFHTLQYFWCQWQKMSVALLGEKFRIRIRFLGGKFRMRVTLKLASGSLSGKKHFCALLLWCVFWLLIVEWLPADKQLEHLCTFTIKDDLIPILARNSAAEYSESFSSECTLCWMKKIKPKWQKKNVFRHYANKLWPYQIFSFRCLPKAVSQL